MRIWFHHKGWGGLLTLITICAIPCTCTVLNKPMCVCVCVCSNLTLMPPVRTARAVPLYHSTDEETEAQGDSVCSGRAHNYWAQSWDLTQDYLTPNSALPMISYCVGTTRDRTISSGSLIPPQFKESKSVILSLPATPSSVLPSTCCREPLSAWPPLASGWSEGLYKDGGWGGRVLAAAQTSTHEPGVCDEPLLGALVSPVWLPPSLALTPAFQASVASPLSWLLPSNT